MFTVEQVRTQLRARADRTFASHVLAARAWGVSPAYLSMVLTGVKRPSAKLLAVLSLERRSVYVVTYRRRKTRRTISLDTQ